MAKRIYFELEGADQYTVAEFERTLEPFANGGDFARASDVASADVIVLLSGNAINKCREFAPRYGSRPIYCWDSSDFPLGMLNGMYCSMSRPAYSKRKHANTIYPIVYNEVIREFDAIDAGKLLSFCGGISAPIRRKLVAAMQNVGDDVVARVQGGDWNSMYDRSGVRNKVDYADIMKGSKFIACPRGNGFGSIRLFETLKARRVPVIISDRYVLPPGIDWKQISIVVKESDVGSIVDICRKAEPQWEMMAAGARKVYEQRFSGAGFARSFGETLLEFLPSKLKLNKTMVFLSAERSMKNAARAARGKLVRRR